MNISYDTFIAAFLSKVREYEFIHLLEEDRQDITDGYLLRACTQFNHICTYDLSLRDKETREFTDDFDEEDIDEIVDIVSEGMLVQWLKPLYFKQENYENMLNTTDYNGYSPANLLEKIGDAYITCCKRFKDRMNDYSFRHGDIGDLHT